MRRQNPIDKDIDCDRRSLASNDCATTWSSRVAASNTLCPLWQAQTMIIKMADWIAICVVRQLSVVYFITPPELNAIIVTPVAQAFDSRTAVCCHSLIRMAILLMANGGDNVFPNRECDKRSGFRLKVRALRRGKQFIYLHSIIRMVRWYQFEMKVKTLENKATRVRKCAQNHWQKIDLRLQLKTGQLRSARD